MGVFGSQNYLFVDLENHSNGAPLISLHFLRRPIFFIAPLKGLMTHTFNPSWNFSHVLLIFVNQNPMQYQPMSLNICGVLISWVQEIRPSYTETVHCFTKEEKPLFLRLHRKSGEVYRLSLFKTENSLYIYLSNDVRYIKG